MSQILEEAVVPVLQRRGLSFFRSDQSDGLLLPLPTPDPKAGYLLFFIDGDDDQQDVLFAGRLCTVDPPHRADVALLVAQLNQYKGVTFGMSTDGDVTVDTFLDLAFVSAREAAVDLAIKRLIGATGSSYEQIINTSFAPKGKRARPSLVERQLSEVLRRAEA